MKLLIFSSALLLAISASAQTVQPSVALSTTARQSQVVGAGINVEDGSYLLKDNLLFDNQGFEQPTGAVYINCKSLSDNICISDNQYAQWPAGFANGWTFRPQVVGGGKSGTVINQLNAYGNTGLTLTLSVAPGTTHLVLEGTFPSHSVADISQWQGNGSGSVTLETTDVADGQQAVLVDGSRGAENFLRYFDNSDGVHSGTQLNGNYELDFMAKPGTASTVTVDIVRYVGSTTEVFLHRVQALTPGWQHYSIPFTASENGTQVGNGRVLIQVSGGTVMLDDISMPLVEPSNATPFRSVALAAMKDLHPGSLRYMNGAGFAVKIDDAIQPINLRRPALPATTKLQAQLPSVDYYQALQLAQVLGSHAWITLPQTITPLEMQHLVEWLAGASTTPYGAKRAARGQTLPWTSVFDKIYLELGNEVWNGITDSNNAGDPQTYGKHTNDIFTAAHASASWNANITMVADGWNTNGADAGAALYWEQNVRSQVTVPFMMSEAPYLYTTFNDGSSTEAIYGPLYAESQMFENPTSGLEPVIYKDLRASGNDMGVYEENLGTNSGTATQSQFDSVTSTIGSGIAVADQMLQLIGLGVKTQNLFTLFGLHNQTYTGITTNLWGAVIDIGGSTNIKRPTFLVEQMVNAAAMSTMLTTTQANDPTYNSVASSNDGLPAIANVKNLRSYAFTNGAKTSLVLINMSRTAVVSPTLTGFPAIAPESITQLTSGKITDDNEVSQLVTPKDITSTWTGTTPKLPPFSMTVYAWNAPPPGVTVPPVVTPPTPPVPPTPPPVTTPTPPVTTPTPPATNKFAPVAPPIFSLGSGTYRGGLVENIIGAPGTDISYSLDGAIPNTRNIGQHCYRANCPTLPITKNTTLIAVACTFFVCSPPVRAQYVISPVGKIVAPKVSWDSGDRSIRAGDPMYFYTKFYGSYPFFVTWTRNGLPQASAFELDMVTSATIPAYYPLTANGSTFIATITNVAGTIKDKALVLHVLAK